MNDPAIFKKYLFAGAHRGKSKKFGAGDAIVSQSYCNRHPRKYPEGTRAETHAIQNAFNLDLS